MIDTSESLNLKYAALEKAYLAQQVSIEELHQKLIQKDSYIEQLKEAYTLARRRMFGVSSEMYKADVRQLGMFNEAEVILSEPAEKPEEAAKIKKTPKRRALPEYLPREEVVVELSSPQGDCGHDLEEMGEEVSEKLEVVPMQLKVIKTIRKKYACKVCKDNVQVAPVPQSILPKSKAGSGLLAYIAVSKYADALPLYRQSEMFERLDIDIPRNTMATWMVKLGEQVQPLINLMLEDLQNEDYLQVDETRVQVLKELGKRAQSQSYMWLLSRGSPFKKPNIIYHYDPTREGSVAVKLLDNFSGYMQADGYGGYNKVPHVIRLGCMAHARRKFMDASKVKKNGHAGKALSTIQKLYRIEKQIKDQSIEKRQSIREKQALPILQDFKLWLDSMKEKTVPSSTLGKAIQYSVNNWKYLTAYTQNGQLRIDNNQIENYIRPFAIGRKNWMFSHSPKGALASANLSSLIQTAKANKLNPQKYLKHVFDRLPKAQSLDDLEKLLPYNVNM